MKVILQDPLAVGIGFRFAYPLVPKTVVVVLRAVNPLKVFNPVIIPHFIDVVDLGFTFGVRDESHCHKPMHTVITLLTVRREAHHVITVPVMDFGEVPYSSGTSPIHITDVSQVACLIPQHFRNWLPDFLV